MKRLDEALKERAEHDDDVSKLYSNFDSVYNFLERDYYRFISDNCQWFTDHGKHHIESVINQASGLLQTHLEQDDLGDLDDIDVYLLLMSIIWHDVGMVERRAGHEDITDITERVQELAFPNPGVGRVIEAISRAHTGNSSLTKVKSRQNISIGSQMTEIRPRALAGILRFADEISESQTRVSGSSVVLNQVPEESKIYWEFARAIPGIIVKPKRGIVVVEIELNKEKACEEYSCPDDYLGKIDGENITLMEYIVCRLEKMNNEKAYCAPEFRNYVDIREIEVRVTVFDDSTKKPILEREERLGNAGLRGNDSYPDITIFDEFFSEHDELRPNHLNPTQKSS